MKIVLENIHKSYGKRTIVNRVNLTVASGEIVGLLGLMVLVKRRLFILQLV